MCERRDVVGVAPRDSSSVMNVRISYYFRSSMRNSKFVITSVGRIGNWQSEQ